MFPSGEKIKGEMCMSAQGLSVKGSSQQSSTSFPKVKGGGAVIFRPGPTYYRGVGKRYYTSLPSPSQQCLCPLTNSHPSTNRKFMNIGNGEFATVLFLL